LIDCLIQVNFIIKQIATLDLLTSCYVECRKGRVLLTIDLTKGKYALRPSNAKRLYTDEKNTELGKITEE